MMNKHTLLKVTAVVALLFGFSTASAVVPPTMNYQAYLTDDTGVPIDGTVDVELSIYNVAVGGTALWTETRLGTTVNNGVLSVELGDSVPFPLALFEAPLWIGVKVGADTEMTPRRPITSTGFAFKAGDADTLDGISASSLDQSAHVADMANPHNVTTAQIGAISGTELTAHAGDSSAHHVKTGTFSELSGQIGDVQIPALIARDAEIMPTVLAGDGPGSGLNADFLDGLTSSAFMSSGADLWVNTTGDNMTGDLTTTGRIGIGMVPTYNLDVRDGVSSYLGYFFNDNNGTGGAYGIYTSADAYGTGTGFAAGATNHAYGGSAGGDAYGSRNYSYAYGSSPSYAVYADAEGGLTTGNEFAFYGLGKGYFSDNLGIGTSLPDYKLHVSGGGSTYMGVFDNTNNVSGTFASGTLTVADARGTGTGSASGTVSEAYGGSTSGSAYGSQNWAYANGASNAYGVYSDATGGSTTGREYAFYGWGDGFFSDNLGVGTTTPLYKLHVHGGESDYMGYFHNDNNVSGSSYAHGTLTIADARGTGTGNARGTESIAYGGSTSGNVYSSINWAHAYGVSTAYGVYSDATPGTTTGKEYAFYGIGEGYLTSDLDVDGTSYIGYERVFGTGVPLVNTTSSCGTIHTGTCYYGTATVTCPTGKVEVGGGCRCNSNYNCSLIANYPSSTSAWSCTAVASLSSYALYPYVNCARISN